MTHRHALLSVALSVAFVGLALPARAQEAAPPAAPAWSSERYYEITKSGQKIGYSVVRWRPSTWGGKPTIHDTTTNVTRSVRNMAGYKDTFEQTTTLDIERAETGELWSMRTAVQEAGRTTIEQLTWNGKGYDIVTRGTGTERSETIPLDAPVALDVEAFAGGRLRAGKLPAGTTLAMRELDVRGKRAREVTLELLPAETLQGEAGPVACTPVRNRDPESGAEQTLWLDAEGVYVQLKDDGGTTYRRVTREKAVDLPVRPHEYPITAPATPVLERIFTLAKQRLDLHLMPDRDRKLPDLPTSPWSKVTGKRGDDQTGWTLELELSAYDDPAADAPYPLDPARLPEGVDATDLAATNLMPCAHPDLVQAARQAIGDARTLRTAAHRLVRHVYSSLEKASPEAAEPNALEILKGGQGDCSEHCVLFVALCRAAGIPARRCRGYACLGSLWGAHSFSEIWVGKWISADPTTGELGGGARYVFFGYPDRAGSYPTVVAERVTGRMRFLTRSITTSADEGGETLDLSDARQHKVYDKEAGRARHLLCGIELVGLPADWRVDFSGATMATIRGPGLQATLNVSGDQGQDLEGSTNETFAGQPAMVHGVGGGRRTIVLHSRRRMVRVWVGESTDETLATLERCLAPTFAAPKKE